MADKRRVKDPGEVEGAASSALHALFDVGTFKAAGSLLGIVSASGGSLAALSFGIGYLAVKKHDEMVGLPTTVVDYTTYVRTGALFFSNSLFHLFSAPRAFGLIVGALVLALLLAAGAALYRRRARPPSEDAAPARAAATVARSLVGTRAWLLGVQISLLIAALLLIRIQAAVFDPINRDLLNQMIETRNALLESGDLGRLTPPVSTAELQPILAGPSGLNLSQRVQNLLQQKHGRAMLQQFYGEQLALLLLFFCAFVAVRLWRKRVTNTSDRSAETPGQGSSSASARAVAQPGTGAADEGGSLPVVDMVTHFFLWAMVIALAINIPATYGILVLPTDGTMVEIHTATEDEEKGILLTDMSTPSEEIWILGRRGEHLQLVTFQRSEIDRIVLTGRRDPNFLAVQAPE